MAKLFTLGLVALASASIASAQTFPKPPDVAAYSQVAPSWPTGSNAVTFKGASDTPPAAELADIPSPNASQLKTVGGTVFCTPGVDPAPCTEAKFRSHLDITHILYDDPIRGYGQPGSAHCHLFFGSRAANAYSTFSTLRNRAQQFSRAGGGGLNGTAYWMPCLEAPDNFGDGKNYAALPGVITLYYAEDPTNNTLLHPIPLGLRYISGFNMDDGGTYWDSILAAANTAAGFTRYYRTSNTSSTETTWLRHQIGCLTSYNGTGVNRVTTTGNRHFVEADGSDPWGGNCPSGGVLQFTFQGASCWDGVNLWSPGGYKHLVPTIFDTVSNKNVCPQNYYRLPELQLNFQYKHLGFNQFKKWRLASDGIAAGQNTATVAGKVVRRGETFHTDWFGAWDKTAFNAWQNFCIGVKGQTPHQCDSGTINATESLLTTTLNPQTGRNPQVNINIVRNNAVVSDFLPLPSSQVNIGKTLHVHAP